MGKRKHSLREMQRFAASRRGACLSIDYKDFNSNLEWKCAKGHVWQASPHNVLKGSWCPHCAGNIRLSIRKMKVIAQSRRGECISTEYVNSKAKLQWRCEKGHIWWASPQSIRSGTWCRRCAGLEKHTLEEMQRLAESKGGRCLSTEYISARKKLKWQCGAGHQWTAIPDSILQGHWCPRCVGRGKTIEDMIDLAKQRGGVCLSEKYLGSQKSKLRWQCENEHKWEATAYSIEKGSWCPYCKTRKRAIRSNLKGAKSLDNTSLAADGNSGPNQSRPTVNLEISNFKRYSASKKEAFLRQTINSPRKYRIEDFQELAALRGGKCLSNRYVNSTTKLIWQCEKGHTWQAIPGSIKAGSWCPYCVGYDKRKIWTIQDMQKIASHKGGTCLSNVYQNTDTKLDWQCKEKHTWHATPYRIINGAWCPICSEGVSERICRKFFEVIFNDKFPKTRPHWLIGQKGRKLELDGYSQKLAIAFEYQGKQHYRSIEWFQKTVSFKEQQEKDRLKRILCKKNGVKLIHVPYYVDYEEMADYIVNECIRKGIDVPRITSELDHKLFDVYSPEKLKRCQQIAASKGWRCLSDTYIRSNSKLKWQCSNGHTWEAHISNVKTGRGCPYCSRKVKPRIEELKQLAELRGGKCLSTEYANSHTKLTWMCKEGHIWESTTQNVKTKGRWCPVCGGSLKLTIDDMRKAAEAHGGQCLSSHYINAGSKLEWRCKRGHKWWAIANNVRRGHWCPTCARGQ